MANFTLLLTAGLFGGMTFFSFGFATVLFKQLPIEQVRKVLRGTFPYYYLVVIIWSAVAALAAWFVSPLAAGVFAGIAVTTLYARQILMHQINAATDRDDKRMFNILHGVSVILQLAQIAVAGWAVVLLG